MYTNDPTHQNKIVRQLTGLIEEIRYKRYEKWHDKPHPKGYSFTQRELIQCALPTYGNLLIGRSRRLPARQQILGVSEYLECTIHETNDLLRCAQYLPVYEPLTQYQTETAINRAKRLMSVIALPAVIMGVGGEGIQMNDYFLQLNNLPPMPNWEPEQRNVIHSAFDNTLPSHKLYKTTPEIWKTTAQGSVELLKSTNSYFRHEAWFVQKLEKWKRLPEFNDFWNSTEHANDPYQDVVSAQMYSPHLDVPITEQSTIISFSEKFEVSLIVWQPADNAARHVYNMLGCSVNDLDPKMLTAIDEIPVQ